MNLDDARFLAADLMRKHKLPREWSFGFDRSKVRFGKCDYAKSGSRSRATWSKPTASTPCGKPFFTRLPTRSPRAPATDRFGDRSPSRSAATAPAATATKSHAQPKFRGTCPGCRRIIFRHRRTTSPAAKCADGV